MKQHKMEITPIKKLVITMSLPAIISMTVQALYNIVDSVFIGQYATSGLTAVSLAFPLQMVIVALFVGLGVGVNTFIARSLGAKRADQASEYAWHGLVLTTILFGIIFMVGLFGIEWYFPMFTNDTQVIAQALTYTRIVMVFSVGALFAQTIMSIMQGSGNMVASMWIQLTGAVVNIILDPILIFGMFGLPAMGVAGAAIATVIGQFCSMLVAIGFLMYSKNHLAIKFKGQSFNMDIAKNIVRIGIPVSIQQGLASIMLTLMNLILAQYGDVAITVMGIYFKLQSFVFMPVFGLNQGLLPILSYNYGAKNRSRMVETLKVGTISAVIYMTLSLVVFQLFPQQLLQIFNASGDILILGQNALRIISIAFPIIAISITLSSIFQATGQAKYSMYQSLLRMIVLLVPLAYLFFQVFGVEFGWIAFPISELFSFFFVLWAFRKVYKQAIAPIQ